MLKRWLKLIAGIVMINVLVIVLCMTYYIYMGPGFHFSVRAMLDSDEKLMLGMTLIMVDLLILIDGAIAIRREAGVRVDRQLILKRAGRILLFVGIAALAGTVAAVRVVITRPMPYGKISRETFESRQKTFNQQMNTMKLLGMLTITGFCGWGMTRALAKKGPLLQTSETEPAQGEDR